ncbi:MULTISPECIES: DUF459 domain-containing protein [unclassified Sinorhizobium]|uniref:SGNH/GDSL hydrolase family protein n=1 Tax=unclassified Sinorhizobium TaxID=2613772 RepID=UPI0035264FD9
MAFGQTGKRVSRLRLLLTSLIVLSVAVPVVAPPAEAQERYYQRRGLLGFLFGWRAPQREYIPVEPEPPPARRRAVRPPPRSKQRAAAPKPPQRAAVVAPRPEQPAVQKLQNARKILVVGDFLAGGLGDGLAAAFEKSPGVSIETRSNVASGLVRDDYYNWQAQLPKFMDEVKPSIVVVAIGANDRQQVVANGVKVKFRTDEWFAEYQSRVLNFDKIVTDRNVPLLWVGLPAFEPPEMTADAVQMNQIYRKQVEKAGGEFIDVWDGFVDENGKFVTTGSDINGQQVRLRTADGINMTDAGRRKLAFYVEKSARRLLGDQASPDIARLDPGNLPDLLHLPPSEMDAIVRTQPINISDPNLDGGTELLGAKPMPTTAGKSPRDLLVESGKMAPAPAGRVDDYRLQRTSAAP